MKNRAITLLLVACFVSPFAFADNPSDAPLVIDNGNAAVIQQDNRRNNCEVRGHKQRNKSKQNVSQAESLKNGAIAADMLKDGGNQERKSESGYIAGATE